MTPKTDDHPGGSSPPPELPLDVRERVIAILAAMLVADVRKRPTLDAPDGAP